MTVMPKIKKTEGVHKIIEPLRPLATEIKGLVADAQNARWHDERNIEAIMRSLDTFGQRKPIVVQRDGSIVRAGNGTVEAAKRLGWTQIAAVFVDDDEVRARAFAVADNRSAELAEWDFAALVENIRFVTDADIDSLVMGFSEGELRDILAAEFKPAPVDGFDTDLGEYKTGKKDDASGGEKHVTFTEEQMTLLREALAEYRKARKEASMAEMIVDLARGLLAEVE